MAQGNTSPGGTRKELALSQLRLDARNPRFGGLNDSSEQADILDHIVETFTVDDVLSSLAVNGYFDAEPMVCRVDDDGGFTVVEGNRRLSACLILTSDRRASRQASKTAHYQAIWNAHGKRSVDPVPCIVFDRGEQHELLSYLGVRHIASAQPWDSYAKAAWVAQIKDTSGLPLADISLMIGDQHKTIARLLEGYYLIKQLIDAKVFDPQNSQRRGRGSVSEYPFSWVYTILGYGNIRKFLKLRESGAWPPVMKEDIPKAALVIDSMFGDRSRSKSAAIEDSREIGALAAAFGSDEKIAMLESGKSLKEIERQTQPIDERLRRGLGEIRDIQRDLSAALNEGLIGQEVAAGSLGAARANAASANRIHVQLSEIAMSVDGDDE